MTKPNRNKKKWKPKFCIACNELIKPNQKSASYQAASMSVYYFHESCYNELLGSKVGGRDDFSKVVTKVREEETRKRERDQKLQWQINPKVTAYHTPSSEYEQEIAEHMKVTLPKAHVEEFEPSQDTKDDHLNLIIAEIRTRGNLTSEQLAEFIGIKRSTITWRLWDNTIGNTKSKDNQELFYFDKGPKGVQYYGLVSERIKEKEE